MERFDAIDIDAVVGGGVWQGIVWLQNVLVILNGLYGIAHLVVCQEETEVVRLVLVIGQVSDGSSLGLGGDDQSAKKQQNDCDFCDFLQRDRILIFLKTTCFPFYCEKPAAKLGYLSFLGDIKRRNSPRVNLHFVVFQSIVG